MQKIKKLLALDYLDTTTGVQNIQDIKKDNTEMNANLVSAIILSGTWFNHRNIADKAFQVFTFMDKCTQLK